jgi:hypothetical protein
MDQFIAKHADQIEGILSCFDRMIFRGYLPFFSGYAMASFLEGRGIRRWEVKSFGLAQAARVKAHAHQMAARQGRPYQDFGERTHKQPLARELAQRDHIEHGLVAVVATLEPCRTFSLRWQEGSPFIQAAKRTCLFFYSSFMDRELGLIHVQLQIYVNGHEWLPRKLTQHGVGYTKDDSVLLWLEDFRRAQTFADRFVGWGWVARLDRDARRVNPLLQDVARRDALLLGHHPVRVRHRPGVQEPAAPPGALPATAGAQHAVFPRPGRHELSRPEAARPVPGEVVTDQFAHALKGRLPGRRVKHRMKQNWIKMYDTAGLVLRVETGINQPGEFRVRRRLRRHGRRVTEWGPLRKSVAYLFRYRELALQSNARYLNAFAHVDDPTPGLRGLDAITTRKHPASGRTAKAFNPVARADGQLFPALMSGEPPCTASRMALPAPSLRPPRSRSTTMPPARVPRRLGSSTVSTGTGCSRRFPALAGGGSRPSAIAS